MWEAPPDRCWRGRRRRLLRACQPPREPPRLAANFPIQNNCIKIYFKALLNTQTYIELPAPLYNLAHYKYHSALETPQIAS